jgi:hypothetical protein
MDFMADTGAAIAADTDTAADTDIGADTGVIEVGTAAGIAVDTVVARGALAAALAGAAATAVDIGKQSAKVVD